MYLYHLGISYNVLELFRKTNSKRGKGIVKFTDKRFKHPIYLRKGNSDIKVFEQIFIYSEYKIMIDFEPKVIFDCGANIGLSAVYYKNTYPDSKIICVEPELGNYNLLLENTKNYDQITCYNAGVWTRSTNLYIEDNGYGDWGFMVREVDDNISGSIKGLSLEDLMKENNIDIIDILKIDIEGSEKEIFETNYDYWLSKTRLLIIELHDQMKPGCAKSFFEALSKYDFSLKLSGENLICCIK